MKIIGYSDWVLLWSWRPSILPFEHLHFPWGHPFHYQFRGVALAWPSTFCAVAWMTKHQTDSNSSEIQFLHTVSFEVTDQASWYNKMLHEIIQDNGKDSIRETGGSALDWDFRVPFLRSWHIAKLWIQTLEKKASKQGKK